MPSHIHALPVLMLTTVAVAVLRTLLLHLPCGWCVAHGCYCWLLLLLLRQILLLLPKRLLMPLLCVLLLLWTRTTHKVWLRQPFHTPCYSPAPLLETQSRRRCRFYTAAASAPRPRPRPRPPREVAASGLPPVQELQMRPHNLP